MKTDPHDSATGFMSSESGPNPGLTKREHFAAMAMQGMIANPDCAGGFDQFARDAIRYADALIAELNK